MRTVGRIVCSGSCQGFAAYGSGLLALQRETVELMPPYKVKQERIHMKIVPYVFVLLLFSFSEVLKGHRWRFQNRSLKEFVEKIVKQFKLRNLEN